MKPAVERYETLFSASDRPEGVAVIAQGMSDMVQEHAYWGGARDRIPLSQTHDLAPSGAPRVVREGLHRRVLPHENLCLIRSGQDWATRAIRWAALPTATCACSMRRAARPRRASA